VRRLPTVLVNTLADYLMIGSTVIVHCRGGLGSALSRVQCAYRPTAVQLLAVIYMNAEG